LELCVFGCVGRKSLPGKRFELWHGGKSARVDFSIQYSLILTRVVDEIRLN
jgi:hypothetical protein